MGNVLAQIRNPVLPPSLGGGDRPAAEAGGTAVGQLITGIIGAFFVFSFLIAFVYLITGAFYWVTSSGDKNNLQNARDRIVHALVGLLIVSAAYAVFRLVGDFFGIDIVGITLPAIK